MFESWKNPCNSLETSLFWLAASRICAYSLTESLRVLSTTITDDMMEKMVLLKNFQFVEK